MQISKETVDHVAHLAKLELSQDEFTRAERALGDIISHAEILNKLPLNDSRAVSADEFNYPKQISDPDALRPDTPGASTSKDLLLKNAVLHDNDYFIVPKTVD
jgi:aspartyl-tRNA(Asn)/glutamyl-tRNA(Gln) amidotransferase subunit C